ncbi:LicD family protein [Candidatus Neomarinimicrobiota bacterium]
MATDIELTGENLKLALKILRDVTSILEARKITYCLDGGTLLGIMREGRLLPWDHDLDLFVPSNEVKKVKAAMWKFRLSGYWTDRRRHGVDKPPCRLGDIRVIKVRNRRGLFSYGLMNLDIFIKYREGDNYYWIAGAKRRNVIKCVPSKFYDHLTQIEFDGKKYWIPEAYDEYLTHRFGDWRTPVKEWDHLADDQAIIN